MIQSDVGQLSNVWSMIGFISVSTQILSLIDKVGKTRLNSEAIT
jgi:hypothetical protein